MFRTLTGLLGLLGRMLLCAVFVAAAAGYTAPSVKSVGQLVADKGILPPEKALPVSVGLLIAGIASVVLGFKTRLGALLLLLYLGFSTYSVHGFTFWIVIDPEARQEHLLHLATNFSLMGAMLVMVANGAGPMSLDAQSARDFLEDDSYFRTARSR